MDQEIDEVIINDWEVFSYNYTEFKRVNRLSTGMTVEEIHMLIDFLREAKRKLLIVEEASYNPNYNQDFTHSEILWDIYNIRKDIEPKEYPDYPDIKEYDWNSPITDELYNKLIALSYNGSSNAQYILGELYDSSCNEKDQEQFEKALAAADSDPSAMFSLAIFYDEGIGVERNPSESRKYLELACQHDYPEALFIAGKKANFPDITDEGKNYLERAAALGHPGAIEELKRV